MGKQQEKLHSLALVKQGILEKKNLYPFTPVKNDLVLYYFRLSDSVTSRQSVRNEFTTFEKTRQT